MIRKFKKLAERARPILATKEKRRELWPEARRLSERHIRNCRLIVNRYEMLKEEEIPKGGTYAEIGIWKGHYSAHILENLRPTKLHLVDLSRMAVDTVTEQFKKQIDDGLVEVHHSDSAEWLLSMPDEHFDWIYIDGDHSYEGVRRDLAAAHQKIKPDGVISLNDYIFVGSTDLAKYGVIEAVNEFCIENDFELIHFALHGRMYNDVTIRKIRE